MSHIARLQSRSPLRPEPVAPRHFRAAPRLVLIRPSDGAGQFARRERDRFRARFWMVLLPALALFWGGVTSALLA